jgi:hypothetical protein
METTENRAGNKKAYIGVIVALLLINSVTMYMLFSEKHHATDLGSQKMALEEQFKSLTDTLDYKKAELEQFRGKTAELDQAITAKQAEIDKQKKDLQNLLYRGKLTTAQLNKAKKMIAEYEGSIAEMTQKINQLTEQNTTLTAQNTTLNTDLTTERNTTAQLSETNKTLAKKVEVGSLLQLAKVDVEAIKKRNNGKEVDVKHAKAAESLKITFETGQNKVLDAGPLSLYVRIINPKGETIVVQDQGSGVLQSPEAAEMIPYTKKADFDYDQNNKKVIVYWSKNIQAPGTYKVQVYQGTQVIGQGSVTLS